MRKLAIVGMMAALAGCKGGGEGTVALAAWGEEAPYDGFPNAELSFVDGWALSFNHSITAFGNVELADPSTEEVVASDANLYVADFVKTTDPAAVSEITVAEGRYKFSFDTVAATAEATAISDVNADALGEMIANGWSTYIDGQATKGDVTVTFKWGMPSPTHYRFCLNGEDDTDGIAVSAGESTDATMFFHQDHTYWDRLGTEEANLRFDAPAAWADENGEIHLDDLADAPLAPLEDASGEAILDANGDPLSYDDAGLGLQNLKAYILYTSAQFAHMNGGGECAVVSP